MVLLVFFFSSVNSIDTNDGLHQQNVNDSNEDVVRNFPQTVEIKSSATTMPLSMGDSTLMLNKAINVQQTNDDVEQKMTATSSRDNDYRAMKCAFDTFNEKIELFMTFYVNELSFVTTKLNNMNEKLNTFGILQLDIDRIVRQQNMAEQKLNLIQESIGSKLDRLEFSMQQLHIRIEELIKQKKLTPSNEPTKKRNNNDNLSNSDDEQYTNFESKIEQLVAFVHNFAELNRLESTDILNRLGNMQSQLIQFFDAKETIATNQISQKSVNGSNGHEMNFNAELLNMQNYTIVGNNDTTVNSTDGSTEQPIELQSTGINTNDDRNLSNSNLTLVHKRKRFAVS